jgi:hypothetical protein
MPARGRPDLVRLAQQSYQRQTYPHKELWILDDDENMIARKRNRLCGIVGGEIVIHWDSDDWSSEGRMLDQVRRLQDTGRQVTGYHSLIFHVADSDRYVKYRGAKNYALGTSLCYRREWWQRHRFSEARAVGEDNEFVSEAAASGELVTVDGGEMMVALIHAGNTSKKDPNGMDPVAVIPKGYEPHR